MTVATRKIYEEGDPSLLIVCRKTNVIVVVTRVAIVEVYICYLVCFHCP